MLSIKYLKKQFFKSLILNKKTSTPFKKLIHSTIIN